jgi:hypothetical protein
MKTKQTIFNAWVRVTRKADSNLAEQTVVKGKAQFSKVQGYKKCSREFSTANNH